jgi:DNA invertase Pin-like site-specific DNA recombinase
MVYTQVTTDKQSVSGLGPEAQKAAALALCAARGCEVVVAYVDA